VDTYDITGEIAEKEGPIRIETKKVLSADWTSTLVGVGLTAFLLSALTKWARS
jgi:hypothetical protein